MRLSIERTKNLDKIAGMRFSAYSKYLTNEIPGDLVDDNDRRDGSELYVVCGGDKAIGSFRLNFGPPLPYERYWPDHASSTLGMEISRMTVDPQIINPGTRYRAMYHMLSKATERALNAHVEIVYTTATRTLATTYAKLVGFQFVDTSPVNIPPGDEFIHLLRLHLDEKVRMRAKKAFSL